MAEQTPRMQWPYPSDDEDPWYSKDVDFKNAVDASVYAAREDRHFIMAEGGTVAWDLGTETLSWSAILQLSAPITGFLWQVNAGNIVLANGEVMYVTLTRGPGANTALTPAKASTVPSTDGAIVLAIRIGDVIWWRNGLRLGDGDSASSISPGSGGGGAAAVPMHFTQNGIISGISTPTDFVDGLREVGVIGTVTGVVVSQEIDGGAGATTIELYKVDPAGVETQITTGGTASLAAGGGAKARALSASFIGATATLVATDRLGIKITAVQTTTAADLTVTVLMSGVEAAAPVTLPGDDEVTQAINGTVLGTTPVLVGSIYLPAGTIVGASSRVMLGTDQVADTASLELRRFTGGAVLDTITATGVLQEAQPSGDIVVPADDWYDLYLYSDVVTTNAILRGLVFTYVAGAGVRVRQAFDQTQTGTTPLHVGSVYLPAGTLQAASRCMLGTSAGGTATLELRRFTGGAVITTWGVTGALADEPLGASVPIAAADWYDIYIYGDAGPTVAQVKGLDWTVLT